MIDSPFFTNVTQGCGNRGLCEFEGCFDTKGFLTNIVYWFSSPKENIK